MAVSIQVAATSSPPMQEFLTKNGFKEEEEGGEDNMEGFVHK